MIIEPSDLPETSVSAGEIETTRRLLTELIRDLSCAADAVKACWARLERLEARG